ncbi:unnamed protein product [Toxocara canis]|uniref:Uncharacterized protein n=1 Tax=Toxocara canis TaxID=6265 RepID=A0A183V5D8_TOXCA|nr:unnamed protein product [Toxocara canis]
MASPRSKDRCNRCVVDYAYKVSHLNIVDQIVTDQADKQAHLCRNESSTDSHADVHTQHLRRTLSQYQTAKANSKLRRKTNLYPSSNTSLAPQEYNRESPPPIAPQKVTFDRSVRSSCFHYSFAPEKSFHEAAFIVFEILQRQIKKGVFNVEDS